MSVPRPGDYDVILLAAGCSRRLAHLTREVPKSFLEVGGRRIIERSLARLDDIGFERVVAVVGYHQDVFRARLGNRWGGLNIRYVEAVDYASTGHGWSLYLTRDVWARERRPVLLIHADLVYDPRIVRALLECPAEDAVAVDDRFQIRTHDEVVVLGDRARVSGIGRLETGTGDVLGEVVGINRWSPEYLDELFSFMETFFERQGRNHNWEPVVDAFLPTSPRRLHPVLIGELPWINVNYEEDLQIAEQIVRTVDELRGENCV